jgi:stage IV sporulation protein FB
MFGVPGPTPFDLRFRLLGVSVRVHPFLWLATLLLAWQLPGNLLLVWVACVFVSILVHEYGHALVARVYGAEPDIWLYMMGGLTVYENDSQRPGQRLLVLIMGPGAGFLFLGGVLAFAYFAYGITPINALFGSLLSGHTIPSMPYMYFTIRFLIIINVFFGLINLLPVIPLDGGRIAEILLTLHNRRAGRRRAYILSLVTAGLATIFFFQRESFYMAIIFAMMAFQSYQVLQALHQQATFGGSYEDDADWWKR